MNKNRRMFFLRTAALSATPIVGVAKVCGVVEKPKAPRPFETGGLLTAKDLNDQFDYVCQRLDAL
mgnify:CR=1 FL=1